MLNLGCSKIVNRNGAAYGTRLTARKETDMRTYSYAALIVNGSETAKLDVYREHSVFSIFENDENVFRGTWSGAVEFIELWKNKWKAMQEMFLEKGIDAHFEQTIK